MTPWIRELKSPPTPWEAFSRLTRLAYVLFLDSARTEPLRGRYSYITAAPLEFIRSRAGRSLLLRASSESLDASYDQRTSAGDGAALGLLGEHLFRRSAKEEAGLPPFQGGVAGVFGYGLCRSIERLAAPRWDEFELPDLALGIYDWVVAFDHEKGTCHVISHGFSATASPEAADLGQAARARRRGEAVVRLLRQPQQRQPSSHAASAARSRLQESRLAPSHEVLGVKGVVSSFSRAAYLDAVERCVEYIRAGDIFQVNLSQRFLHAATGSPLELYRRLRASNPAPFAGYFDLGDLVVASSSPEQFLTLSGSKVVTRPIKGTRRREYTPEADAYSRDALFESDKDRAENVMIVDLLRNDISRVSRPHTVKVPRLFDLEGHPTVHHLVSEVHAELRQGMGALDLLQATFPGGSITGAPKVRAMEIIAELEPTARGPYCGSLGWIAFHGGMSLNILIRTMTVARGWIQFPAGGGIVAASTPENEYQETLHKAEGMLRAL